MSKPKAVNGEFSTTVTQQRSDTNRKILGWYLVSHITHVMSQRKISFYDIKFNEVHMKHIWKMSGHRILPPPNETYIIWAHTNFTRPNNKHTHLHFDLFYPVVSTQLCVAVAPPSKAQVVSHTACYRCPWQQNHNNHQLDWFFHIFEKMTHIGCGHIVLALNLCNTHILFMSRQNKSWKYMMPDHLIFIAIVNVKHFKD